ncbi:hypothetical protein MMC13_003835 [Lambiella insularis]|nr:hypothetical protein [Lambiella insularis]
MVKLHTATHHYDYPLPAVSLAYFLRYPNPYSTHVLSTDVISRHFDPVTQRLQTVRLHLKRSKLPTTVLKLLPKGILGSAAGGDGKSFILEKSTIDVREGWMETESRNLEWTGILSVVERQRYTRTRERAIAADVEAADEAGRSAGAGGLLGLAKDEATDVTTTVTFLSRLGQPKLLGSRRKGEASSPSSSETAEDEAGAKPGFLSSWSTAALQRTIEATGVQRTRKALVKSKEGMIVVLERLRTGGLVRAVEGMRRDRELVVGGEGPWKRVWQQGRDGGGDGDLT